MSREKFEQTCREYIKRDGIEKVLTMLAKTDFYTAPASTRYHDSEEGGLVKHSLQVFNQLCDENKLIEIELQYPIETLAIVSLFHDLCKIGYYKTEMRNTKNEQGKWIQVPYYTVEDRFPYGHGEKSVYMLGSLMKLTDEEAMAIRWHMGAYSGQQDWNTLSKAYTEFPLAMYLHFADMKATYLK